jgi:hypothetical protein
MVVDIGGFGTAEGRRVSLGGMVYKAVCACRPSTKKP